MLNLLYKTKILFILSLVLFVQACSQVYIKNQKQVEAKQLVEGSTEGVTVCSGLLANQEYIESHATYMCLRTKQQHKLVSKTKFASCSFSSPVASNYECFN